MCGLARSRSIGSRQARFRHGGFTLVELLVVIGIIALLISILLPSLQRARESAYKVQCMSMVRQHALMSYMYANDNNGTLPRLGSNGSHSYHFRPPNVTPEKRHFGLAVLVAQEYLTLEEATCPSAERAAAFNNSGNGENSYAYRWVESGKGQWIKTSEPANTAMSVDRYYFWQGNYMGHRPNHPDYINVSYLDGSALTLKDDPEGTWIVRAGNPWSITPYGPLFKREEGWRPSMETKLIFDEQYGGQKGTD